MSLTSLIRDEGSPLSLWLAERLPGVASVRRAYRAAQPVRRVRRPVAPRGTLVRWDTLGTAIDHRLRCAFAPPARLVPVSEGVALAARLSHEAEDRVLDAGRALLAELREVTADRSYDRDRPWALPDPADERLARICYAMAWFEEVFRDGRIGHGSPLADADSSFRMETMLAAVPDYAVRDLRAQVALAETALDSLRGATTIADCVPGPSFEGSGHVGGADADLIVGGLLLDIKTTGKPEKLSRETIYQLAGYPLLDYSDGFQIRSVGLYLARIGWLMTWDLDDFFALLGARRTVADLRNELADLPSTTP